MPPPVAACSGSPAGGGHTASSSTSTISCPGPPRGPDDQRSQAPDRRLDSSAVISSSTGVGWSSSHSCPPPASAGGAAPGSAHPAGPALAAPVKKRQRTARGSNPPWRSTLVDLDGPRRWAVIVVLPASKVVGALNSTCRPRGCCHASGSHARSTSSRTGRSSGPTGRAVVPHTAGAFVDLGATQPLPGPAASLRPLTDDGSKKPSNRSATN